MSGIIEDECWVCGTLTRNRCSACTNRDPGVDIFLCSRACQKLVNPIHRIFCGNERTNPFRFPPLSQAERDEFKPKLDVVLPPRREGEEVCSYISRLVAMGFGEERVPGLIDGLTIGIMAESHDFESTKVLADVRGRFHILSLAADDVCSSVAFAIGFTSQIHRHFAYLTAPLEDKDSSIVQPRDALHRYLHKHLKSVDSILYGGLHHMLLMEKDEDMGDEGDEGDEGDAQGIICSSDM